MTSQLVDDERWEIHPAVAGLALWWSPFLTVVADLGQLGRDRDDPAAQVEVAATQPHEFSEAQLAVGSEKHQGTPTRLDGIRQHGYLTRAQDGSLSGAGHASAADPAGVRPDKSVLRGRLEDGVEEAIGPGRD